MDSTKVTSISSTAVHPHIPRPKGPDSSPISISETLSALKQEEEDPSFERLKEVMNKEMIAILATLFHLEAASTQTHSRLQKKDSTYSPTQITARVGKISEALDRLDLWSIALRKRVAKVLTGLQQPAVSAPPAPVFAPPAKEKFPRRVINLLRSIFSL